MELEVTWKRATKVWWSYVWRNLIAVVAAFLISGLIGAVLGFVLSLTGMPLQTIQMICAPIGLILGILVSIIPMKMILNKEFGNFRLVIVENPK